tara:strand:+ start:8422 stop:9534 length:1113 start_codon:yes stop_codon:yes gene_type:complete
MENIPKVPDMEVDISDSSSAPGFIMKLALILVMIIVVVFFVRIGIAMVFYFNNPNKSPYLIDGMIPGNQARTIKQNPSLNNSVTIYRSKNEMSGMEFTWSLWLWIRSGDSNFGINNSGWKHVFHKGNNSLIGNATEEDLAAVSASARLLDGDEYPNQNQDDGTSLYTYRYKGDDQNYLINYNYGYDVGMAWPNNSPGLYLDSGNNTLKFILSTHAMDKVNYSMITSHDLQDNANMVRHDIRPLSNGDKGNVDVSDVQIKEEIDISNVPLDKWVCLVLRVKNNVVDVYVNGVITNRHYPLGVIKQNTYDVHTGQNGGFDGYISRLKYDNKALSAVELQDIYKKGPKTKLVNDNVEPEYAKISKLSNQWYGN